ncbi:MAG: rubrerythrin family protein [Clostridia bacterium]|nr:rubrerythrin family protein [Clostridia bacterium]
MELKGSKTEANLMAAFAGESQARNKYNFYAQKARKDGFEKIAALFDETAANEKEHAELWLKYLHGGALPDTLTNLTDAAGGEHFEWSEMYAEFAQTAKEEGFLELSAKFSAVAAIEKQHEERFLCLRTHVENGTVFSDDAEKTWKCMKCGHTHNGKSAPAICPVCGHTQSYFESCAKEC